MNRKCLLLIPLFFSSVIITACDNKPAVKTTAMEPEVGVVTLVPSSVNIKSELPGRAVSFEIAEIRPQVGGIIIKRNFIEGDKVSKGESLYQIDPAPLQARLDSAKGALAKALATANNVRLTLNRQSALIKSNYVSRQDYDTTRHAHSLMKQKPMSPSPKRILSRPPSTFVTLMSPHRLMASAVNPP